MAETELERRLKERCMRLEDQLSKEQATIERLRKENQILIDAVFSICQKDWGIANSIAVPAHKALKAVKQLRQSTKSGQADNVDAAQEQNDE